jgi:hypothetical protein
MFDLLHLRPVHGEVSRMRLTRFLRSSFIADKGIDHLLITRFPRPAPAQVVRSRKTDPLRFPAGNLYGPVPTGSVANFRTSLPERMFTHLRALKWRGDLERQHGIRAKRGKGFRNSISTGDRRRPGRSR